MHHTTGGDLNKAAIDKAKANISLLETREDATVELLRWDFGKLPLKTGSVSVVISNLPFGIRFVF